MEKTSGKAQFASKIGLVAATVGSAVGLGNVWRFPAEAQANGGAAFLLLYIVCVLILGVPVMLAEFSMGRYGRSDAIGVFQKLAPKKKWWIVGAFSILTSYLILSFYMVVAGWTLEYLFTSITGNLFEGTSAHDSDAVYQTVFTAKLEEYIFTDWKPTIATCGVILINLFVLLKGVQKGIEKMSNIMMPLLFVILVVFALIVPTLPGASAGYSFFLKPDFSKITPEVVINALGQTFFSLSLAMGILITYAGYYPSDTRLTKTSITVSLLSVLVAILVGLTIFPAITAFHLEDHELHGATLVFLTLPEVFAQLPGAQWWSAAFFLLLFCAALTSTISLAEVAIALLQDRLSFSRKKATFWVLIPLFIISPICSMSQGSLSYITVMGMNIFDLLDNMTTNIMLPLTAIATCIFAGWFVPKDLIHNELTNYGSIRSRLYPTINFILKYLSPLMILAIFVWRFI